MKRLLVVAAILAVALSAAADWYPEDPAKWVQMPDLDVTGIDVNTSFPYFLLADDFLCTETGPITDVHIWGSWYHDMLPDGGNPYGVNFTLSLHADIPADPPDFHSRPGQLLWEMSFYGPAGEFVAQEWATDINEGWMDPPDVYEFPGDHVCWQYNFFIPEELAFIQQGTVEEPVVYWLDVQADPLDDQAWFGWKTSVDHWNDDAVWGYGPEPYMGPWFELVYPQDHMWGGQSIDLAFVITTVEDTTHQDELDWGDAPDPTYPTLASSTGANHLIVPGIFMGTSIDSEPNGQPDASATGDDNDGNDDEDGVAFPNPFYPGGTTHIDIDTTPGGFIDAWFDWNLDGSWTGEQELVSYPVPGGVNGVPINVPATATVGSTVNCRFRFSTAGGLTEYGYAPDGEVEDYQVQITEEVTWKWLQRPDLETTGIDVNATSPFILADDWECTEPGRVDEIHVWGSWLDDYWPFGEDPANVRFTLSIHDDIPANPPDFYSRPGDVLWIREFLPGEALVVLEADNIQEGWLDPPDVYTFPADWTCWHYIFHIPPDEAFHQVGTEDNPIIYWLDVQAEPEDTGALFGWKTSLDHWNDDAVWGMGAEPYFGPWNELIYPFGHQMELESIDLAFMIRSNYGTGTETIPERTGLFQNTPNPFNPQTTIAYEVPVGGSRIAIDITDVSGRVVRHLVDGFEEEGKREVTWDGRDSAGNELPSGVYFYKLVTPETTVTRKMTLLK